MDETKKDKIPSTSKDRPDDEKPNTDDRKADISVDESKSNHSRQGIEANEDVDLVKVTYNKREVPVGRKRRGKIKGRVNKRRRSTIRRQVRKPPKAKRNKIISGASYLSLENPVSLDSEEITMSSGSERSRSPICRKCGHRCCLKRFKKQYTKHKWTKMKVVRTRAKKRSAHFRCSGSDAVQVGSRCAMLSPLFIKSNNMPDAKVPDMDVNHRSISPEMIHETMLKLMKWRQNVMTIDIMNHMRSNYPVNRDRAQLFDELTEKLLIAVQVGFLIQVDTELWSLSGPVEKRKLSSNHVTLFWKIYGDTMRPVSKKLTISQKPEMNTQGTDTI